MAARAVTEALRFVPVDIGNPFTSILQRRHVQVLRDTTTARWNRSINDHRSRLSERKIRRPLLVSAALGAAVGAMVALILTRR
jgi:hypothetical protein